MTRILNGESASEDSDIDTQGKDPNEVGHIYQDLDAKEKFYTQAKNEIIGYNRKPNLESAFYHDCNKQFLLAQPIFKCVSNNTIKYQGKTMAKGYA
jgi:hypothetical protein